MSVCLEFECDLPKLKGKHRCPAHWEATRPPDERAQMAAVRRESWNGVRKRGDASCSGCGWDVPSFYKSGSKCKSCAVLDRRGKNWGLSSEDQKKLYEYSDGRCYACSDRQHNKTLATDHSHLIGYIRGLLCQRCNHDIIGSAFENPMMLLQCAVYLLAPPAYGIIHQEGAPDPLTDRQIHEKVFELTQIILKERNDNIPRI